MTFPSIDLGVITADEARSQLGVDGDYAVHDRDFFLEMALGLWFHTRHLVGKPTRDEIAITLKGWPKARIEKLIRLLEQASQIA